MEAQELLNDLYGHCGECHELHFVRDMVAIDGYFYCKACSLPVLCDEGIEWTVDDILRREG